jgi:hypothetical protein
VVGSFLVLAESTTSPGASVEHFALVVLDGDVAGDHLLLAVIGHAQRIEVNDVVADRLLFAGLSSSC